MRKLEDMSYKDALTGFGNRFAMNRYISQIDHKKSMGVVYCDITGLKHVNDTMGHKAGDQLILRARDCLSKAFGDYGVFRIGGDELLALCSQIEQDVLEERIRLLKKLMEENTVNMAVGMIWQDEATTELDILLQESEKRMYADKAEYYIKERDYTFSRTIFFLWFLVFHHIHFFDGKIYRILYFFFLHFQDVILDCLNPIPQ